ncbi:Na(+)-translocating NADH-quinone reductase subunit C [Suttonella sp. R2A3]|uniref:Na(+)-translocating NADH-quinone reductase subunit C n=1 Tax=Suttonella sp. R2A3 TaxID=2908648 RepID=UPI001F415FC4|nr:Na(+)-translocating NADH-quinone reductase subunit C [Suttonella sp. R2A3]UJF24129.1 Na(+)-translocating NADH-quinone reductase subunit C [Suttonella sp. R2A3]
MSTPNNSKIRILAFAAGVCLVCSLVVSTAAVALRDTQEKNQLNEKRINILVAAGLAEPGERLRAAAINERYEKITPVVVDFASGELAKHDDPGAYDMYAAAQDKKTGHAVENDPASIKRMADEGSAYLLIKDDRIERVILPVQGYGLWSTMYGFTAMTLDEGAEITGLTFYSHGETPGLGARITDPSWQKQWEGVVPYNDNGEPQIHMVKGSAKAEHGQVDAISGATLTSRGVENLMNFWLGEQGYESFVRHIQDGEITASSITSANSGS